MIGKKLFMPVILGAAVCLAVPVAAQDGLPKRGIDPNAVAEALRNCPGLKGQLTPQALIDAARNCPALSGSAQGNCPALNGKIDPAALAQAAANCPALNGANCPGLQGGFKPAKGGFIANPENAPAPRKSQAALDKKIDKRMNRIVKALERNKRSADVLIQAARDAGADPNAISDMEKMSAAFRQVFMTTVSPQQIVESIIAAPAPAEPAGQGMIITGPDGTTWFVTPNGQNMQQPPQPPKQMQGGPAQQGPRGQRPPRQMQGGPAQQAPDMQMPQRALPPQARPQGMPPQGRPGSDMLAPPRGLPPQMPPQGFRRQPPAPAQQNAPQGELIIMEETITPEYLPLWPTKEDIGKDGVLKYLEKRSSVMNRN